MQEDRVDSEDDSHDTAWYPGNEERDNDEEEGSGGFPHLTGRLLGS